MAVRTRTDERAAELARSLDDPALMPFLPALYAAWIDGDLTDDEIARLCERVRARTGLAPHTREALELWLDPTEPPATNELRLLRDRIAEGAQGLPEADRLSLVDLGLELPGGSDDEPEDERRAVLTDLVRTVGDVGLGAIRRVLRTSDRLLPTSTAEVDAAELPAVVDAAAITRLLEPDADGIRAQVMALLPRFRVPPGTPTDAYRETVLAWCRELADLGLGRRMLPAEIGGDDDLRAFLMAFETLGYGDLSLLVKYGVQFGLFGGAVLRLGNADHHERYLRPAATLELPGCFAMTETGHGSDVQAIRTTATYDAGAGEFVLRTPDDDARKDYIGNAAAHGRAAVVFAQLDVGGEQHGVHAFVVPIRGDDGNPLPGVRIADCGQKLGLNGVDNGRLWFDGVRVPRDAMLDRFAAVSADGTYTSPISSPGRRFFAMIGTLVHGRVSVASAGVSAAKTALAIAVRYAERRRQFGAGDQDGADDGGEIPLLDYLTHQRRLLIPLARTYALHFAVRHLVDVDVAVTSDDAASDQDVRRLESLAAALKAQATWHATATIQECREACGGAGYLAENRFAALKADTDVFTTFEGDNTVLFQLVAKGLLTGYRQQFEDMNLLALVRFVGERALGNLAESNPFAGRNTAEAHLRDRELHLGLYRFREEHVLDTLARRLKALTDGGTPPAGAFLACQDHVLTAARAHVERVILEQFVAGVAGCADAGVASVLDTVCDLYALSRVEADRAWFLEHGQLATVKAKAVAAQVNELCRELRPHARALVEGFGIPDEVLAAPIAVDA